MRYRHNVVWLLGAAMLTMYAVPVLAGPGPFFQGPLIDVAPTEDPTDDSWAVASATVQNGRTIVRMNVKDVDAVGATFGAHVHVGPCVEGDGTAALGHYHTGAVGPLADNEVWLDFTVTPGGTGHAVAVVPFEIAPGAAQSIVIHAMPTAPDGSAGARMACLPLEF